MAEKQPGQQALSRGLKDRHVQLIALVVRSVRGCSWVPGNPFTLLVLPFCWHI